MGLLNGRNLDTTTQDNLARTEPATNQGLALLPPPARRHEVCAPAIVRGIIAGPEDSLAAFAAQIVAYCDCEWGEASGQSALVAASPQERGLALAKARFVERVLTLRRERGMAMQAAVDWLRIQEGGMYAPLEPANLNFGNFRNWKDALPKRRNGDVDLRGIDSLIRSFDTGQRRRTGDPDFWCYVITLYLELGERRLSDAYQRATAAYRQSHPLHPHDAIPTIRQVRYWLTRYVPTAVQALERKGLAAWKDVWMGFMHRRWDAYQVGEILMGDGHTVDIMIQREADDGSIVAVRPELCAWRDVRSGYWAGARLCPGNQNHLVILIALIDALAAADWRPPSIVVTDWGQDYRTRGLFEPVELFDRQYSIALNWAMAYKKVRPYNGKEKPIERDFLPFCDRFSRGFPTYIGNNPTARTAEVARLCAQPERLPTWEEAEERFQRFRREMHQTRSAGRITTEALAPADAWARMPTRRRLPVEEVMSGMVWVQKEARTVGRNCTINVKHPWISRGIEEKDVRRNRHYTARELAPFTGRQIPVGVVPWTDELVCAYHPDYGTPLCVCRRPLAARAFDEDPEVLAEISRGNNWFLSWSRDQATTVKGEVTDPELRARLEADLGLDMIKPANARLRLATAKQEQLAAGEEARDELAIDRIEARRIAPAPPTEQPVDDETAAALDAVTYGTTSNDNNDTEDNAADLDMAAFDALDAIERPQDDTTPDF